MKTAFATLYPNSILVAAEKGYQAQVLNVIDIHKWKDFVTFIDSLERNRKDIGDDVQTIIIDTVDELYPLASSYVVQKESISDKTKYNRIKDVPYGQGWNLHDEEFKAQIKRIINLGFTILYLTHSKVKTIKPKKGEPYDVYTSTMSDRCAQIVYPACDYIIHGERKRVEVSEGVTELKRVLTVRGNDTVTSGNRVYFDEDIVFDTEEEAMEKFQEKFKQGIIRNLKKSGITTSIEQLEKQQSEERQRNIEAYMEQVQKDKEASPDYWHQIITEHMESLTDEQKKKGAGVIKEQLGIMNYKKVDDVAKLKALYETLQTL